jgi:cell division protein FtsB
MADRGAKAQRVTVALEREESASERWLRTMRNSGFSFVMLGILIVAVIVLAPGLRVLVEQQQQIAELERDVAEQEAAVGTLQQQLDRWSDPAYVVAQARERLLFAYPGESSYLVVGAPDLATDEGLPVSASVQTTRVDWVMALLQSGWAAGLTDATGDELGVVGGDAP